MTDKAVDWLEWIARASLPVVAVTLGGVYVQSERQLIMIQVQSKELSEVKSDVAVIKSTYATKTELVETVKSIDQKLEIMLLRQRQPMR